MITLAQAQAQLDSWLLASTSVAKGQDVSIGNRRLTLADAAEINKQIVHWERRVRDLTAAGANLPGTSYAVANFADE